MKRYLLFLLMMLTACTEEPKLHEQLITIKQETTKQTLAFSGLVQPMKAVVIPSPVEGVVVDTRFQYGEKVTAGQFLFSLSSSKFLTDYKAALVQYIKTKNDFNNGKSQLSEAEFLFKNELISRDDYKTRKSNYYGTQLAYLQAKDALEVLIKQMGIKDSHLYELSIADIEKITNILRLQLSENIKVTAPVSGVVLSANKGEDDTTNKKITKGDGVKQGDVLAVIGNMQGLSVRIKVNELTVNQLKIGQKVVVTGVAFPDDNLHGEIKRIDHQADTQNSGLPTFNVDVLVPTLTPVQQQRIHVGMSAKVDITIQEEPAILVPMTAIQEKEGVAYVQRYQAQSKKIISVPIKTGKTTLNAVTVLSGLKAGDKIVIPHTA